MLKIHIFGISYGNFMDNWKDYLTNFSSLFKKSIPNTFFIYYTPSNRDRLFKLLRSEGYLYDYLTENGEEYLTHLDMDAEVYWGFRATPWREIVADPLKEANSISEIFGDSIPCLNMNLPYIEAQNLRINLGHESKKDLIELLCKFGLNKVSGKVYYHATLSYAFPTNILVDVRQAEKDEDYLWNKVHTYVAEIPEVESFIDRYYDKIIDDSSVFRVGDTVFGFYDSGLNIVSLDNSGLVKAKQNLEILGYKWNERGFYEKTSL